MISVWGNQKAYKIDELVEADSSEIFFDDLNQEKISVSEYFLSVYGMKMQQNKFMFKVEPKKKKRNGIVLKADAKPIYLPPEYCVLDGVPESIRANKFAMRDALQATRMTPESKFKQI